MSSSLEELYEMLLASGISKEQLERELKQKDEEFGGFMTKQGILFIIAKEHGVSPYSETFYKELNDMIDYDEFSITISELKNQMTNIVLLGRIRSFSGPKEFRRKDSSIGRVSSFLLTDWTGTVKVILWENLASIVDQELFRENEIVRVIGGYSKLGKDNILEVHLGKKGRIILAPQDVSKGLLKLLKEINEHTLPETKNLPQANIKALLEQSNFIKTLQGEIQIKEFKEITKKSGQKTFLLNLIISDSSMTIPLSIWGMNAVDSLKLLENGLMVLFTNLSVKMNPYTQEKELLFTKKSTLRIL